MDGHVRVGGLVLRRVARDRVDRGVWDGCLFVLETRGRSSRTVAAVD